MLVPEQSAIVALLEELELLTVELWLDDTLLMLLALEDTLDNELDWLDRLDPEDVLEFATLLLDEPTPDADDEEAVAVPPPEQASNSSHTTTNPAIRTLFVKFTPSRR